jgi:hypothetical protein
MSTATPSPVTFSQLLSDVLTTPGIISDAYRAFHSYSMGNMIAAAGQMAARGIPIGPIASFMGWKDKGRSVRKGEKAIYLCMPITCKGTKTADDGSEEAYTFARFAWRPNWFALSQTEGQDYQAETISPEWSAGAALQALGISEVPFEHMNGNVQGYAFGKSIAVSPVAALPHKTRFHELAHVVLGHTSEGTMDDDETTPRDIREVEAEAVAFILCQLLGLPGAAESRGYVQSWLQGQEVTEKSAQRIYKAADQILKAGKPAQA